MEFPIYTKHPDGLWYSKLISTKECVLVVLRGIADGPIVQYKEFKSCLSVEWEYYQEGRDIQCTREQFMEAYNKAIETITSKL